MKTLSALLVLMVTVIAIVGCLRFRHSPPSLSNSSASTIDQMTPSSSSTTESKSGAETKIEIRSIALSGWWWSDEQLESNFDADNPPPKNSYVKLDKWDASQPDSPHPDRIDVICRLENHTEEPADISLEAFADFKVASYEGVARGSGTQQAVDEKLRGIQWSDNQKVGKLVADRTLPGRTREVTFKGFDLRTVIDKYFKASAGDRWPWKLRISIIAKNSKGVRMAYGEATIDLIPGD